MKMIRTIPEAVKEFKKYDENTAISESMLRKLVKQRKIPYVSHGKRVFIDIEAVGRVFEEGMK